MDPSLGWCVGAFYIQRTKQSSCRFGHHCCTYGAIYHTVEPQNMLNWLQLFDKHLTETQKPLKYFILKDSLSLCHKLHRQLWVTLCSCPSIVHILHQSCKVSKEDRFLTIGECHLMMWKNILLLKKKNKRKKMRMLPVQIEWQKSTLSVIALG